MTSPNHGIAAVSVDGGAETLVDEYSATRVGDVSVWTSPRLTSGTHTIRVRVTGTKQSAATNDWVTIDRFEIADQPVAGTNYRLVNRNSGRALAIAGGATTDGASVVQLASGGAWTANTTPGGAYTLSYTASGKLLDVPGFSTTLGQQLDQWTANGGSNQQWYLQPTSDGYFTIVSVYNGLAADDYNWNTSDGAAVAQYTAMAAPTSSGSSFRRKGCHRAHQVPPLPVGSEGFLRPDRVRGLRGRTER